MIIEVPDHHAGNINIMLASIGYQMIRDEQCVPTILHQVAAVFNQLAEDTDGTKGDFFETIAQKPEFADVRDIILTDKTVASNSSFKDWS